jgi:hypothetical protein
LLALSRIVTTALTAPTEVGAKRIVTEHLVFGAIGPLQLVENEKSLDPEMLAPLKVTVAPLFFFAVLVSTTLLDLLFPTLTSPKGSVLRES